jgi:nucleotide-binding universal stress UspA family protein
MKNILVSIDFNKNEKLLIDKAFQLAKPFDSKLWLLHITAPEPAFVGYEVGPQNVRDWRAAELKKEHKLIEEYTTKLKEKGVEVEGLLIEGATIETVIEEAKKLNVDLIVVGHHKYNFLYKAFVESISSGIIKKSKIPVLLVPLE